jgi:hypothetical protein
MMPYNLVEIYRPFGGTCLNVQGGGHNFALKTEAVLYFLTSVHFHQLTLNYISEDATTLNIFLGKCLGTGIATGCALSFLLT